MLSEMTPQQFIDWRAYSIIEPFADVRSDVHAAMIVKALWDINRDTKKHPHPFKLEDFLPQFTAFSGGPTFKNTQTMEERRRNLELWALALTPTPPPATQIG